MLERDFNAKAANEAWVGDVTYVPTGEGWLYLAVLLDLFSRRVAGLATSATNDTELALRALDQALRARRPRARLVHHTDRGSPYASSEYRSRLAVHAIVASMSRTGDCYALRHRRRRLSLEQRRAGPCFEECDVPTHRRLTES